MQFAIPPHDIAFDKFSIGELFRETWNSLSLFSLSSKNPVNLYRNYSVANVPDRGSNLVFNVRIALPNASQESAGVGSSYVFNLKEGDEIQLKGPFGDFLISNSEREMIYIGGGAGMAPIRSHLSHLFEDKKSNRKISYWYGARSRSELYYNEYFDNLSEEYKNFSFHVALSDMKPGDVWKGHQGFIHEVLYREYLKYHPTPQEIEYYLCGPPVMIKASLDLLEKLNVPKNRISYDEF